MNLWPHFLSLTFCALDFPRGLCTYSSHCGKALPPAIPTLVFHGAGLHHSVFSSNVTFSERLFLTTQSKGLIGHLWLNSLVSVLRLIITRQSPCLLTYLFHIEEKMMTDEGGGPVIVITMSSVLGRACKSKRMHTCMQIKYRWSHLCDQWQDRSVGY